MTSNTAEQAPAAHNASAGEDPAALSLVLGGPLYQLYLRSRLVRPPVDLLRRRIIAFVVIAWVPLALLAMLGGRALSGAEVPFFFHLGAQVRFLLSIPLLIAAEAIVHHRISTAIGQFSSRQLIAPEDQPRFDAAIVAARWWRNLAVVEVAMMVLSLTGGYWYWRQHALHTTTWYFAGADGRKFTLAGYWYVFVSLPIFRFLLLRWYYRLIIWYIFLWKVSRIPLRLEALHPDRAGGLGFLGTTPFAFVPVLMAQTCLLAGKFGDRIWHEGATLPKFKMDIAAFLLGLLLLVYLPLTFFVLQLNRARRTGSREYGIFAAQYVTAFRNKWVTRTEPPAADESMLGTGDIQSLADLGNSYEVVKEMGVLPFTRKSVIRLTLVLALPLLPLALTMVPLEEMIDRMIKLAL